MHASFIDRYSEEDKTLRGEMRPGQSCPKYFFPSIRNFIALFCLYYINIVYTEKTMVWDLNFTQILLVNFTIAQKTPAHWIECDILQ